MLIFPSWASFPLYTYTWNSTDTITYTTTSNTDVTYDLSWGSTGTNWGWTVTSWNWDTGYCYKQEGFLTNYSKDKIDEVIQDYEKAAASISTSIRIEAVDSV